MSGLKEICDSVNIILDATEPKKGGLTAYSVYHILKTLSLMKERPVGRPYLERILGIGEASVRTLLKRLRDLGLIEKTRNGHVLTEKGDNVITKIDNIIKIKNIGQIFETDKNNYIIVIYNLNPPKNLVEVYKVRDYLVMHGCRFPLVLGGFEEDKIYLPGVPDRFSLKILKLVKNTIDLVNRGVLMIITEECLEKGLSASLNVLKDFCDNNY